MFRGRQSKIVATVGPSSSAPSMLYQLHEFGVDVFRLNFSHGDQATHGGVLKSIRSVEKETGRPITVFADLQGPKIRCGQFPGGSIELKFREELIVVPEAATDQPATIPVPHPELLAVLQPDDLLMLDDGKLRLKVLSNGTEMRVSVEVPGTLKDRKGINIPSRPLPITALTDKDKSDLEYAINAGVDYVALSFVQRPQDVHEARKLIDGRAGIIAKIEKPSAVELIDEIVEAADAIMVARGDLGVEMPPEQVPVIQRRIIRACRAAGKPVIVATHMLESMIDAPTPTRAEASDIATAIFQGADAVMLSAETAAGRHPTAAVAIMDRIIKAAEADGSPWALMRADDRPEDLSTADAISKSAALIAEAPDVRTVVAYTNTGSTAWRLSRERPRSGVVALTPNQQVARQLRLGWGVLPVIADDVDDFESMVTTAEYAARHDGGAAAGDRVVIVTGYPFGRPGKTNTLKISRLDELDGG